MGQSVSFANFGAIGLQGGEEESRKGKDAGTPSRRLAEELDDDIKAFDRSTFAQCKRGKLLDNFDVLEELGTGSFGVVSKGRDLRNNQYCAIKTIPKKKIKDPQKVKEEFNCIRKFDHPHICKAYECYEDRKNIYLIMELLTGGTLLETLCRQAKFTEADAANIMRQILSALSYLHSASFVFRDLKTENVMFRVDQDPGADGRGSRSAAKAGVSVNKEVKLIDFGLCCPFEKGSKICKAAGTPYSVAPELVTSPVQYDQKCDAWSAGVVMYILLSGKYPFNGKTKDELLHNIRREPCKFHNPVWKKISKDAKTLLADLMRKKADQRTSVSAALLHPWLAKRNGELPDENIMADVVDSFKHFQNLNMFQKAAVTALAWKATDDETVHLREIFSSLDRDGNGHITVQELRQAIETTGVKIPEDLIQLTVQADTDGGGTIEYTEFLAATLDKQKVIKEDVVWEAFRIFDQDGSGTITKSELLKILTGTGGQKIRQAHGQRAIENFLDEYDVSGDDVIDFEEFMEMLDSVKVTFGQEVGKDRASRRSPDQMLGLFSGGGGGSGRGEGGGATASARSERRHAGSKDSSRQVEGSVLAANLQRYCPCSNIVRGTPPESLQAAEKTSSPRSARRKSSSSPRSARRKNTSPGDESATPGTKSRRASR